MGISSEYPRETIKKWEDGIPFDSYGHALDPEDLYDENGCEVAEAAQATKARTLTSPYGALAYGVGDDDYFFCFDYGFLPGNKVALHSVVNSETGGFIDTASYCIVPMEDAVKTAQIMLDNAFDALFCNEVKNKGWGKTGYCFVWEIKREVKRKLRKTATQKSE